jgi:hypothetical protein
MQPRSQRQKETRGWSRISRLSKVDSGHAECSYGLQKFKQGLVLGAWCNHVHRDSKRHAVGAELVVFQRVILGTLNVLPNVSCTPVRLNCLTCLCVHVNSVHSWYRTPNASRKACA